MNETLLIIHYLAFSVGIGGGLANMLIGIQMRGAEPATAAALGGLRARIGRASFIGLVLLWLTGLWMFFGYAGGLASASAWFWLKMIAVLGLTAAALRIQAVALAAQRSGSPPDPALMRRLGMASGLAAVLAVIFAVIAFR